MASKLIKSKKPSSNKIKMKIDIKMVSTYFKYLLCSYVGRPEISNLHKLLNMIDETAFEYNIGLYDRFLLIRHMADAITENRITDVDLIKIYVLDQAPNLEEVMNSLNWEKNQLSREECKYITNHTSERLQYLFIYDMKPQILTILDELDGEGFFSYFDIVKRAKENLMGLLRKLQSISIEQGSIRRLNFAEDNFKDLMNIIYERSRSADFILQTGMRQMNAVLSPGFRGSELYVFLGLSGKFKTGTLLNLADQIRLFNPQINPVEDGMRKCILFVTMENTIEEDVSRIVNMYADEGVNILSMPSIDHVMEVLRENGKYSFDDQTGITIEMRFYKDKEINTGELYNIIEELKDCGYETIALFLDYLKRIDSTTPCAGDTRLRLEYVTNELQNLAKHYRIPVISAMQVNRSGNMIIDAAMRDEKSDLLKFIGAAEIGESWAIVENASWLAVINLERQKSTNQLFLSVKKLKCRYAPDVLAADYFNHPFTNGNEIRLDTDVDKDCILSIKSLASDLESVPMDNIPSGPIQRNSLSMKKDWSGASGARAMIGDIDTSKYLTANGPVNNIR